MFKKICALIMAFAMMATMFAVGASAADSNLVRGNYKYTVNGAELNSANKVSAGETVDVEVSVKHAATSAQYAYLYTALFDSTGKLAGVGQSRPWVNKNQLTKVTTQVTAPSDDANAKYDIKSFLWHSGMVPCADIVTEAPAAPANVKVTATEEGNVVGWDAPESTVDIFGYNVYRNDVKIAATTTLNYTDANITEAEEYEYTVTAYGFNEGEHSAVAEEVVVDSWITASLDMSALYECEVDNDGNAWDWSANGVPNTASTNYTFFDTNGLYPRLNTTKLTYVTELGTTASTYSFCMKTDDDGVEKACFAAYNLGEQLKLMIAISNENILASATKRFTVTYLDNGTAPIKMKYVDKDGTRQNIQFERGNTNEWVTKTVQVTDAITNNTKNYSLELSKDTSSGAIYISNIEISAPATTSAE